MASLGSADRSYRGIDLRFQTAHLDRVPWVLEKHFACSAFDYFVDIPTASFIGIAEMCTSVTSEQL